MFEIEAEIKAVVDAEVESRMKKPSAAENADDALAAIMALSEEERIALFT